MNDEEESNIFMFYFDFMIYLGHWVLEISNPSKKFFYFLYACGGRVLVLFVVYMGVLDLIVSIPDFNKISYNVCINLFIIGTFAKNLQILHKNKTINSLKWKLLRSVKTCKDPEELNIYRSAISDIKFITRVFYFFLSWVYPVWLILSFFSDYWGERTVPLPAKWPGNADLNELRTFIGVLAFHGLFALYYLCFALSMDVSMFALLVQIHREYRFLIKKINEFGALCDVLYPETEGKDKKKNKMGEINVFLKKAKARQMLGAIISRQKELLGFTNDFEYSYNISMFIHIFAGGVLLCFNGVQAMIVSFEFSVKMGYQFGYVLTLVSDMLYLCWLTNRISTKCGEVGIALYATPWYKMDVDIQKDISFVILRSQRPPRITSGNFVELNLSTFMAMFKNIYSWLALFRQVVLK